MPISLGKHTPLGNAGRGIPSTPLESIHDPMKSGVAYYHRPMTEHMIRPRRALHAHMALGRQTWPNNVRRDMPSPPLDNSNGRTTSGVESHHRLWNSSHYRTASAVACHHCPWATHAVERCRAWHDITAFGHHTRLDNVGRDMTSIPLDCTHG